MKKQNSFDFDAAGWLFWTLVSLVLLGPAIWLAWKIVDPYVSRAYPVVVGGIIAVIGASVISMTANHFVQARHKKKRVAERKRAKKRK